MKWLLPILSLLAPHWLLGQTASHQGNEPSALAAARAAFERKFVAEVGVLQDKYSKALDQHLQRFTREGKLEAALEAKEEIRRAKCWQTIPTNESRRLSAPQLDDLRQSYERAVRQKIEPILAAYRAELGRLKASFKNSADLDAMVKIEAEIEKAAAGTELPIHAGAATYLSGLGKDEFHLWLRENTFKFTGAAAGDTRLTFTETHMAYDSATAAATVTYRYKLTSSRSLAIEETSFKIHFTKDLSAGEFTSSTGTYAIRINPPETE